MKKLLKKPVFLLAGAAVLLLASTVGSTQAALTYYSENYEAEVTVANIGVTLLENDDEISHRNYVKLNDDSDTYDWKNLSGTLLENMLSDEDKDGSIDPLVLGKKYEERISVKNTGTIDTYVRVIITKSWQDRDGKETTLSPALIDLNVLEQNGWKMVVEPENPEKSIYSPERIVLYYTKVLTAGKETPDCTDTISISKEIAKYVDKHISEDGKTVTYDYTYNGYTFNIEAEVDAVQTHNAADAIKSAWGVDVTVASDGTGNISLN